MAGDSRNYMYMENVLNTINKHFVTLPNDMKKQYNIYQVVIKAVIEKMKETSPLFTKIYREIFFGGSYYDGLKISKPEEYDLDLLLDLPKYAHPELVKSDLPGFVKVKLNAMNQFQQQPEYMSYYAEFPRILDDQHYLDSEKVKKWMQSVITKTLNKFEQSGDQWKFICEQFESEDKTFYIKIVNAGPAFTLKLTNSEMKMDVDLVPCFVFDDKWPVHCGFKPNPTNQTSYFIVPKKPHETPKDQLVGRYWRMSFQKQERDLIKDKGTLKPALKLLKKYRDKQNHNCIASYFLKTIFLHEVGRRPHDFWIGDLSSTFVEMLKVYHSYLNSKAIPYYWNEKHNMIGHINPVTIENIANFIGRVIKEIDGNQKQPTIITKYLLSQEELDLINLPNPKENALQNQVSQVSESQINEVQATKSATNAQNTTQNNHDQIQSQLESINEKLSKLMTLQVSLVDKIDNLNDRMKCIELNRNSE